MFYASNACKFTTTYVNFSKFIPKYMYVCSYAGSELPHSLGNI